jgi:hypothetical protein
VVQESGTGHYVASLARDQVVPRRKTAGKLTRGGCVGAVEAKR